MSPVDHKDVNEVVKTASDYWDILCRLTPISIVGGVVAMVINFAKIVHEHTWVARIVMLVSVVSVGCVGAGAAALGISLFVTNPSKELELLAGALAGASGQKVFDIYSRRLFGISTRKDDYEKPKRKDYSNFGE